VDVDVDLSRSGDVELDVGEVQRDGRAISGLASVRERGNEN
jgi:hypothetical protein